jgi:ATP-dependent Clp endopeptidase proteolytic subunit ClpP
MKEGHIWIDGEITENYHLTVKKELEANASADVIVIHIQSPGGSVYAGYNTYHVLKSSGKRIKSIIEGEAQSMATFISLAGDEIEIRNPSVYMIHNPSSGIKGDADMMISGASELRNIENDMAEAYAIRTKLPVEKVKEMMKATTVLNAKDAVRLGFADRVIDPLRAVAIGKTKTMENNGIVKAFEEFKAKMEAVVANIMPAAEVPPAAPVAPPVKAAALPAGEYPMQDGSVIVVDETGMIIEVRPAAPSEPMPTEDQKMIQALQAELATIKASAEESEKKATQAATALGTIKTEFEALRKKTVGDDSAPKAAAVFKKEPNALGEDNDAAMRDEIFEIGGLNWIKNIKRN